MRPGDIPQLDTGAMRDMGSRAIDFATVWGPRVLAAAIILLIGWLIARAVKWAVASLVDKTALGRANHPDLHHRHPDRVGSQIGSAAYWLVLLATIAIAAQPLGLATATGPLSTMLNDFAAAIPNIFGAGLIFFVGSIVASVARKAVEAALTAAHAERLTARMGIPSGDAASLPKMIGTVVFALIIIPVAIAALDQLHIRSISEPATAMLRLVLDAIPHVIAAGIIIAIAIAIGRFAGQLLTQFLHGMGFDSSIQSMGMFPASTSVRPAVVTPLPVEGETRADAQIRAEAAAKASQAMRTPSGVVGTLVMVAVVLFGLTEAFRQLQFDYGSKMMVTILGLLGSVTFGAVIIAASVAIAGFVARIVAGSTGGGVAPTVIRVAIIVLGTAIGLRYMGLADDIINLAFGLILGAAALAAALAFGLGGRQAAAKLTERMVDSAAAANAMTATPRPTPTPTTAPRVSVGEPHPLV